MKNKTVIIFFMMSFGFFSNIYCSQSEQTPKQKVEIRPRPAHGNVINPEPKIYKELADRFKTVTLCGSVIIGPFQLPVMVTELVLLNTTIDGDVLFHEAVGVAHVVKICCASRICGRVINGTVEIMPKPEDQH